MRSQGQTRRSRRCRAARTRHYAVKRCTKLLLEWGTVPHSAYRSAQRRRRRRRPPHSRQRQQRRTQSRFPHEWGPIAEPSEWQYAGPAAASEPETQVMIELITALRPDLVPPGVVHDRPGEAETARSGPATPRSPGCRWRRSVVAPTRCRCEVGATGARHQRPAGGRRLHRRTRRQAVGCRSTRPRPGGDDDRWRGQLSWQRRILAGRLRPS
jgi:hypothetical protein